MLLPLLRPHPSRPCGTLLPAPHSHKQAMVLWLIAFRLQISSTRGKSKGRAKEWSAQGCAGRLSPHTGTTCHQASQANLLRALAVALAALQECCLCTSPGFSPASVLLVQIGESQGSLQTKGEIPSGHQPGSQQGQRVPFGLTGPVRKCCNPLQR